MGASGAWEVNGREVRLTNLDKVLFPATGQRPAYTKRDLIRYYVTVAPALLPHLAGRALNMHRYPDGVHRKGFWHKELPTHAPAWLSRWTNAAADLGETSVYVVADHTASLAWLANFGAVELHPWTSETRAPDCPTFALIDIDPGPRTAWEEVLLLARLYRTALEHLRVDALPKVTGKRGIQIWVPIAPGPSFHDTRAWVETLSRAVGATVPELVSWEWEVHRRNGLARLDFTQNAINKTLVAPYSVRADAGAPVSTPITWAQLDDAALRSDAWDIDSVPGLVQQHGDLFARATIHDQRLPALQ
jgi:bifunctional non-homologous end joining protein LigD